MGMFDGVKDAKVAMDSTYIRPVHGILRIDRVKVGKSRKGREFVAVEMTVVKVFDPFTEDGQPPHRPGEAVTDMKMSDNDYFLGEMKAFLANTCDVQPEDVTPEDCELVTSDENPLGGVFVEVLARNRTTKEGKDFTKISYKRPVSPEELVDLVTEEEITKVFSTEAWEAVVAAASA